MRLAVDFAAAPLDEPVRWWDDAQLQGWVRLGVFGLVSLLLLLLVVRPAVRSLTQRKPALAAGEEGMGTLLANEHGERLLARVGDAGIVFSDLQSSESSLEDIFVSLVSGQQGH